VTGWREARGEGDACLTAVMQSIMNRVRHPGWWGNTVSKVVTKPWQYSSLTDPRDRQLTLWPVDGDAQWEKCLMIADSILSGSAPDPTPGADSYYDVSIPPPYWADPRKFVGQVGKIRFYNLDGDPAIKEPA
jgi:spore germination cell wall hydrolase CwlJ-like protein